VGEAVREREGVAGVEAVGVDEVREVVEGRGEVIVDMVEESWSVLVIFGTST